MQLNKEQPNFLKAVIDGVLANNNMFEGTPDEILRADFIAQLSPDLHANYTELLASEQFDSHPEAMFYLALATIVEGQPDVDTPVWLRFPAIDRLPH